MNEESLHFIEKDFSELSSEELYALLRLRAEVFVVEQNCVYLDLDGIDQISTHLIGYVGSRLEACARWYRKGGVLHLGRIVTSSRIRGTGAGKALVAEALARIGNEEVFIQAQAYLERFYSSFGWVRTGPDFPMDGIPHIPMLRPATTR